MLLLYNNLDFQQKFKENITVTQNCFIYIRIGIFSYMDLEKNLLIKVTTDCHNLK